MAAKKLKNIEVNPGKLCNNKCVFCMSGLERDKRMRWAPLDGLKREIRDARKKGFNSLGFLGGEATVYPRIVECVAYAKSLGYERIVLCTNAVRTADKDFAERITAAGVTRFALSIHSHIAKIEETLVRVPGILKKKLKAVDNLVALQRAGRLPHGLSLNPVLCRPNLPHMADYVRFFAKRGVRDVMFNYVWPQADAVKDKGMIPKYEEALPEILKLLLKTHRGIKDVRLRFGAVPFCVVPKQLHKRTDFLLKYFNESGDQISRDVSAFRPEKGRFDRFDWLDRKLEGLKSKVPACEGCRFIELCQGVYDTYLTLYGPGEFKAVK